MRKLLMVTMIASLIYSCSSNKTHDVSEMLGSSSLKDLEIKLDVKKYTLSNGLRLLVLENKKLPIFTYYTFFDIGGRFESEGTTGATHFLEHMMFKGAKKYGPGQFFKLVEGNGGSANAYTSFDSTVYHEQLPSKYLELIVDMESDRMGNILLEEKSFEKERQVVLEERKMRYENSPQGKMFYALTQSMYRGTPYGGSVIGSAKDVKNLSRERMLKFHKDFYVPNNAVIVVVGDVDSSEVHNLVEEHYGDLKSSSEMVDFKKSKDSDSIYKFKAKTGYHKKIFGRSKRPIFTLGYRGEKLGSKKSFVLDILSSMLGDGNSSYLSKKFVKGRGSKLSSVYGFNYALRKSGLFIIGGELLPKVNLSKFRNTLIKSLKRSCNKGLTDRSLQKIKNQFLIHYYSELKKNSGMASFLGQRENFFGDYKYYEKELEIYNEISLKEVKEVCREMFNGNKQIFVSVWDKHKK